MALIIPLGFVTASNTPLITNVPVSSGVSLRCNKVLVQAFKTANSNDYVFVGLIGLNKATGSQVVPFALNQDCTPTRDHIIGLILLMRSLLVFLVF